MSIKTRITAAATSGLATIAWYLSRPPREPETLVLASTGDHNIGDVALLRAFLDNIGGRVRVLAPNPQSYPLLPTEAARVRMQETSAIWGSIRDRLVAYWQFGRALRAASSFSVIGADNMDGGYGDHFAESEWRLARLASKRGVPTRVLGFSWSTRPTPRAIRAMRRAARSGVTLYARDPESSARLRKHDVEPIDVADMVFAIRPDAGTDAIAGSRFDREYEPAASSPFYVLNVSALVASRVDLSADYQAIVDWILQTDAAVVVLPHVGGRGNDDRDAAAFALGGYEDNDRVFFVSHLMTPRDVSELASRARAVITGRMHLSVIAMNNSVPAFAIATQGKVEGLMHLMGVPEMVIDPSPGFSRRVINALADGRAMHRSQLVITASLPGARALAMKNFEGLPVSQLEAAPGLI